MSVELRKMLGKRLHKQVVAYLEQRRKAAGALPPVAHPAAVPVKLGRKK
jgi:hypothetical protein